jgi:hypothetical protein
LPPRQAAPQTPQLLVVVRSVQTPLHLVQFGSQPLADGALTHVPFGQLKPLQQGWPEQDAPALPQVGFGFPCACCFPLSLPFPFPL